jgi:hypothetical protein
VRSRSRRCADPAVALCSSTTRVDRRPTAPAHGHVRRSPTTTIASANAGSHDRVRDEAPPRTRARPRRACLDHVAAVPQALVCAASARSRARRRRAPRAGDRRGRRRRARRGAAGRGRLDEAASIASESSCGGVEVLLHGSRGPRPRRGWSYALLGEQPLRDRDVLRGGSRPAAERCRDPLVDSRWAVSNEICRSSSFTFESV